MLQVWLEMEPVVVDGLSFLFVVVEATGLFTYTD